MANNRSRAVWLRVQTTAMVAMETAMVAPAMGTAVVVPATGIAIPVARIAQAMGIPGILTPLGISAERSRKIYIVSRNIIESRFIVLSPDLLGSACPA